MLGFHRHGMLLDQESGEGPRLVIVEHREVLLLEIVNALSMLIADDDRHQHNIDIDVQRQPSARQAAGTVDALLPLWFELVKRNGGGMAAGEELRASCASGWLGDTADGSCGAGVTSAGCSDDTAGDACGDAAAVSWSAGVGGGLIAEAASEV